MKLLTQKKNQGFTLLMAALVTSLLLAIGFSLFNLSLKQVTLSSLARDSQLAFYAADTGIECAIYWDYKYSGNGVTSAFATSTTAFGTFPPTSGINCGGQDIAAQPWIINPRDSLKAYTSFNLTFSPDPYCATIQVQKTNISSPFNPAGPIQTIIESRGYNTCNITNPRRVERAIRVRY